MSVIVYGGHGALGRFVVNRLKQDYRVISIDLRTCYQTLGLIVCQYKYIQVLCWL